MVEGKNRFKENHCTADSHFRINSSYLFNSQMNIDLIKLIQIQFLGKRIGEIHKFLKQ